MAPFGWPAMVKYVLSNLRPAVPFKARGVASGEMDEALTDKTDSSRQEFLETIRTKFCQYDLAAKNYSGWESRFKANIAKMMEICRCHGIQPVVYRQPLLAEFSENLPQRAFDDEVMWIDYFRSVGMLYMDLPKKYGQDLFHDHMHLTTKGAKVFTQDWFAAFGQKMKAKD